MAKADKGKSDRKALLLRIRKRHPVMTRADRDNRRAGLADLKFVNLPGEQWDANMKKERGERPCYEFNKLRISGKRVINDMRANRPSGKVRPVEGGDKQTADTYEGLIRNIWNTSDGDTVIDYAGEYQVGAGFGAWRVETKYASDASFEQDIALSVVPNPFCLYWDPAAKDLLKRDAQDWILTERIARSAYKARWPKAEVIEFEGETEFDDDADWQDEDDEGTVRVCEYWWREPATKEIWQVETEQGIKVVDAASDEAQALDPSTVRQRRLVQCHKVRMCIASGDAILEGPTDWAGSEFPFVVVFGEYLIVDGKCVWFGLPRFGKDAQRSYNVARTSVTETIALAPQFKWWATPKQAQNHTDMWAEAHRKNFPFMLYNTDAAAPGAPQSMNGPQVPAALIQEAALASEEIKAVTGIYDASLGAQSNETSGKAITARKQQGEIATFNFRDNMAKGVRRTWEILIDLIPKVYDTERELRVLGFDGQEDYVRVNTFVQDDSGKAIKVNDLSVGRYDVTVTTGPAFATQRQEATEIYTQLGQAVPQLWAAAGDLIMKSMDLPYAEKIAERMQALLPPPVQAMLAQGGSIPPEAQAVMAKAAQAMQQVQEQSVLVQQAAEEAAQAQSANEKTKNEVQRLISQLEVKKAQFDAHVAQVNADFQVAQAQGTADQDRSQVNAEREAVGTQMSQAVAEIQQRAAQFMTEASQTLAAIQQQQSQPRNKRIRLNVGGRAVEGEIEEVSA